MESVTLILKADCADKFPLINIFDYFPLSHMITVSITIGRDDGVTRRTYERFLSK